MALIDLERADFGSYPESLKALWSPNRALPDPSSLTGPKGQAHPEQLAADRERPVAGPKYLAELAIAVAALLLIKTKKVQLPRRPASPIPPTARRKACRLRISACFQTIRFTPGKLDFRRVESG